MPILSLLLSCINGSSQSEPIEQHLKQDDNREQSLVVRGDIYYELPSDCRNTIESTIVDYGVGALPEKGCFLTKETKILGNNFPADTAVFLGAPNKSMATWSELGVTNLSNSSLGIVDTVILSQPQTIRGVDFPIGATLTFYDDGFFKRIAFDTSNNNNSPFLKLNGISWDLSLGSIHLYPNGVVSSGYLGENTEIDGMMVTKGSYVQFFENGDLASVSKPDPSLSDNSDNDEITLYAKRGNGIVGAGGQDASSLVDDLLLRSINCLNHVWNDKTRMENHVNIWGNWVRVSNTCDPPKVEDRGTNDNLIYEKPSPCKP